MSSCTSVAVWMNSTTAALSTARSPRVAAQPRRQQQHGRAHALAAAHLDVAAHLRDELDARLEVPRELALHARQFVADRLEDPRRDPGPRLWEDSRWLVSPAELTAAETCVNQTIGFAGCQRDGASRSSLVVRAEQRREVLCNAAPRRRSTVQPCSAASRASVSDHPGGLVALARDAARAPETARPSPPAARSSGTNARDVAQRVRLRERDDAGKRDVEPEVERLARLVRRAGEAVHHAADAARPGLAG